ncbi:MAG: NCS2 family permease [Nitrospinota bacterium]
MAEKYFHLKERGTTFSTEMLAGFTTFATMSYIIFVQPATLAIAGMDFGAVMTATCISAALGCILMGLMANLPVALAPAMGHNFFFVFTVCGAVEAGGYGFTWQAGLGTILISGSLFSLLSLFGMRDRVVQMMPNSLKYAIAAGIGLFIALIGLKWGGVVVSNPATFVSLGSLREGPAVLVMVSVLVTAMLMTYRVRGAILLGIAFAAVWSLPAGYANWYGFIGTPRSLGPTFLELDVPGAVSMKQVISVVFVFFILDLFDTIGTLTAVCSGAGLMKDGRLPNAREALLADGLASVGGAILGTTTVTSYIESASGVAAGGRTGLTSLVTGSLFLLALFFYPLAQMVGGGYEVSKGVYLYPVIAPALIVVGSFMLPLAAKVEWDRTEEAIPAFLTIVAMPFTFSITEGIAFGLISYSLLHTGIGNAPKTHPVIHFLAACFILRYIFLT